MRQRWTIRNHNGEYRVWNCSALLIGEQIELVPLTEVLKYVRGKAETEQLERRAALRHLADSIERDFGEPK